MTIICIVAENHSLGPFNMGCCHSDSSSSSLELGNVKKKSTSSNVSLTQSRVMEYNSAELDKIINDHPKIIDLIKTNKLSLLSVPKKVQGQEQEKKTLIRKILEEAGDGHEVVNRVLDSYVSATADVKSYSNDYGVTVDFSGIIREDDEEAETGIQKSVLRDILELKMKYQDTVMDIGVEGVTWFHRLFNSDDRLGNKEDFADTFRGILMSF